MKTMHKIKLSLHKKTKHFEKLQILRGQTEHGLVAFYIRPGIGSGPYSFSPRAHTGLWGVQHAASCTTSVWTTLTFWKTWTQMKMTTAQKTL